MRKAGSVGRRALPYAAITAVGMLATDLYLPALPSVGRALGATVVATQASVSAFLIGLAASQLPWGRACDRFGPRASLLVGLVTFVAASLLAALARTMPELVALRAIQGIGAGATTVIVPVMIRRDFLASEAVVALSSVGIAESLAPGLGPVLGATLLLVADYRASFLVVAVLGAILTALMLRNGTAAAQPIEHHEGGGLGLRFVRLAASHSLALGALIAFVGSAPQLLEIHLSLGADRFAAMQLAGVAGFALAASSNGRRVARRGAHASLVLGASLQIVGGLGIAASGWVPSTTYVVMLAGWVLFCAGMGIRGPVVFAAALDVPHARVGTASALIMLGSQAAAAIGTQALAPTLATGIATTGAGMVVCAALAWIVAPKLSSPG